MTRVHGLIDAAAVLGATWSLRHAGRLRTLVNYHGSLAVLTRGAARCRAESRGQLDGDCIAMPADADGALPPAVRLPGAPAPRAGAKLPYDYARATVSAGASICSFVVLVTLTVRRRSLTGLAATVHWARCAPRSWSAAPSTRNSRSAGPTSRMPRGSRSPRWTGDGQAEYLAAGGPDDVPQPRGLRHLAAPRWRAHRVRDLPPGDLTSDIGPMRAMARPATRRRLSSFADERRTRNHVDAVRAAVEKTWRGCARARNMHGPGEP